MWAQLRPLDLVEVLKYPFSTGEAEQIVLKQLNSRTRRDFGGDVWKFVEQANSLGIKDIDAGIEYGMLRLAEPRLVPSVLVLAPPVSEPSASLSISVKTSDQGSPGTGGVSR